MGRVISSIYNLFKYLKKLYHPAHFYAQNTVQLWFSVVDTCGFDALGHQNTGMIVKVYAKYIERAHGVPDGGGIARAYEESCR
jgi:hypothetical protein